jgi:hypothetical protein
MLALWGVGLANSVFNAGVQAGIIGGALTNISAQAGYGSGSKPSESFPLYDVRKFAQKYLALSYCAYSSTRFTTTRGRRNRTGRQGRNHPGHDRH